jgi:hypothetical protein
LSAAAVASPRGWPSIHPRSPKLTLCALVSILQLQDELIAAWGAISG